MINFTLNLSGKFQALIFLMLLPLLLDAQNLSFEWIKTMGNYSEVHNDASMTVDNSGNVYTVGVFSGNADFDPGVPAVNRHQEGCTILSF